MKIKVNGEDKSLDGERLSIAKLLVALDVKMPEMVSVELNDEIVPREQFADRQVSDGDSVEFMYFMGGGARESDQ